MSNRVTGRALKSAVAAAGIVAGLALSGCTALGDRAFGDPTVTGSTANTAAGNLNQPMPSTLGASSMQVAEGQFIPPADIGGGGGSLPPAAFTQSPAPVVSGQGGFATVSSQDLPVLGSNSQTGIPAMPAQQSLAPITAVPAVAALAPNPSIATQPNLAVVPSNAYVHVIESGESLYTIARRYDVTAQSIVSANGQISPDKIFVGQKLIIPGRADLLASKGPAAVVPTQVASLAGDDVSQSPLVTPASRPQQQTGAITDPALLNSTVQPTPAGQTLTTAAVQPTVPVATPTVEPQMSGADKFRWPVSGRVITDFAASKATGINIEAPEGAAVKAAENGTVIYVGSGVEGYGNLILIRHANGYVSAYAHLKSMSVAKGAVVNRGDTIGAAGMTGSVSRPQLHFELRKGATPVDPIPLLAS